MKKENCYRVKYNRGIIKVLFDKKTLALFVLLFCVINHNTAYSAWRVRSPNPFPGPNKTYASLEKACQSVGAYYFTKLKHAGPPYSPLISWGYTGYTDGYSSTSKACQYNVTTSVFGGNQTNTKIIYAVLHYADSRGSSCNNTKNPINIGNGNKFYRFKDISANMDINRYYNSSSGSWTFDYTQKLYIYPGAKIATALRPDGSIYEYSIYNNTYTPITHIGTQLALAEQAYVLKLPDNTTESYDLNGRLISVINNEKIIAISYQDNKIIVNKNGYQLILKLDDNNNIVEVSNSVSTLVTYDYVQNEGYRLLKTVTHQDHNKINYLYEDPNHPNFITGIIDENDSRIASVQYDDQGRAISSEKGPLNSGIERTQIQYHDDGTRTLTNALGKKSKYHFAKFNSEHKMTLVEGEPSTNCAAANKSYSYDTNGFIASKTDWNGNITTYTHNNRGQETSRTEASGTPQARTISTEWHSEFNLPTKIIEAEQETVMTYDSQGRLLSKHVAPRP